MQKAKTVVVTGAGSGIGRATAQVLAADEHVRLMLVGRTQKTLDETRESLPRSSQHFTGAFDIRDAEKWKSFYHSTSASAMNVCGIFANAGTGGGNHYGENDRWDDIISVNLTGTYVSIMECLPYLRKSEEKYRHAVITSSCLGRFGVSGYTAYCTAKTGLLGLTRALALELAHDRILVNAICPGWVETGMAKAGIQRLADADGQPYEEAYNEQMGMVPLEKISQPEEVGELVRFLLSNRQTSITGQGIDINNGSYMN